jgi:hypothetical protein
MSAWLFLWILFIVQVAVEIGWTMWDERKRLRRSAESTLRMKKDFTRVSDCGMEVM